MYPREVINEMNELSKEIFGTTSKWRKILEKGQVVMMTEEETLYNPEAKEGEPEFTKRLIPALHHGPKGGKLIKHETKYYTVDELKAELVKIKTQKAEIVKLQAAVKEELAKNKAEENARMIVAQNSGTAA